MIRNQVISVWNDLKELITAELSTNDLLYKQSQRRIKKLEEELRKRGGGPTIIEVD